MATTTANEIVERLSLIAKGTALTAELEEDLAERGLVVIDHRPYANLTAKGRALLNAKSQPNELQIERDAGQRATFVVYYTRNGRAYIDGLFAKTEQATRRDFLAMAKELGWKVEIDRVEPRAPQAS